MLFPKEYDLRKKEVDKKNKGKHFPFQEKKEKKEEFKPLYDAFTIKTALVAEIREGKIHLFLPPVEMIEHYLDLLAAIELTCEELQIPVIIEGYAPPKDNRIEKLMVTPDPGVIEVNIHPAKSWQEVVNNYNILFRGSIGEPFGLRKIYAGRKTYRNRWRKPHHTWRD
jgi:uncharacterized protein (DUF2126 family)